MKEFIQSRRIFCVAFAIFAFICIPAHSNATLTPYEQSCIDKMMAFRVSICALDPSQALAKVDSYRAKVLSSEECTKISEETQLILDTFLVLESFNYIYERNQTDPRLKTLILAQYDKLNAYIEKNKDSTINKWLYCIAGDAISCTMGFVSTSEAMKRGLTIKDYYLKALEQDPNFSMALVNVGQWFFQAPAIGGGSKQKARSYFERALKASRNNAESYYAKAMLSQCKFSDGEKDAAAELLEQALSLAPGSRLILKMKEVNSVGENYFYYIVHRAEVDKKIAKKAN